jgi:hypothetical protein
MIEIQRQPLVQETRSAFQDARHAQFVDTVHRHRPAGLAFFSDSHVGPDLEVEVVVLFLETPRVTP